MMNTTEKSSEKDIEKHQRQESGTSIASGDLDDALATLDISSKDADEAFAYLRDHPNADSVRQEALEILADPKALRRLLWKIDLTIVPCMIAVYFLQFLDKTTISYTAVMGMRQDTHLVGQDYSNVAMMFYIGFLVAEFPTQYLAQKISRLGKYLGANVMIWGVVLACMSATSSYAGMMICRTLLGVFEAPVAPILVLIIAMWYKKGEQGRRVSYFYVCNSLTQIFGGAVAYGASFTTSKFASCKKTSSQDSHILPYWTILQTLSFVWMCLE